MLTSSVAVTLCSCTMRRSGAHELKKKKKASEALPRAQRCLFAVRVNRRKSSRWLKRNAATPRGRSRFTPYIRKQAPIVASYLCLSLCLCRWQSKGKMSHRAQTELWPNNVFSGAGGWWWWWGGVGDGVGWIVVALCGKINNESGMFGGPRHILPPLQRPVQSWFCQDDMLSCIYTEKGGGWLTYLFCCPSITILPTRSGCKLSRWMINSHANGSLNRAFKKNNNKTSPPSTTQLTSLTYCLLATRIVRCLTFFFFLSLFNPLLLRIDNFCGQLCRSCYEPT